MFNINLLKKYIFIEYSKILFNTILIFFSLGIILHSVDEINFFKDTNADIYTPIFMSVLKTPSLVYEIFPFIFLISSIILFIKLIHSQEIYILRMSGISNFKLIIYPCIVSLFYGLVVILGINSITSTLTHKYLEIKNTYTKENEFLASINSNGIWIKDKIDKQIYIIKALKLENNFLINVSVHVFDESFDNLFRIEADSADIDTNIWKLKNVSIYNKLNNQNNLNLKDYPLNTNFNKDKIRGLFSNLDAVSLWNLKNLKKNYEIIGYSTKEIDIRFQKEISYPFFLMSMTLLAGVVIMFIPFKGGYLNHATVSVILSVIIFYLNDFSKALGKTESISMVMSVWTPLILVLSISLIGLTYVNEK